MLEGDPVRLVFELGRIRDGAPDPHPHPGVGAEERGQSEAIARNLESMARLPTPIICSVIGEGGSGGALAIGVGDRVNMLQYSTYSVISPEGCASILWKDAAKAEDRVHAEVDGCAGHGRQTHCLPQAEGVGLPHELLPLRPLLHSR